MLNETAAIVFDLCDGTTPRAAMVAEVNYPSGADLVSGAVFGRLAGASAARSRGIWRMSTL